MEIEFLWWYSLFFLLGENRGAAAKGEFIWFNGKQPVTYAVSESVSPVVTVALDMFKGNMRQVTGA